MRNLSTPANNAGARRPSSSGLGTPLASPNQARYKGIISTPGLVKFSGWKRETDIPKVYFHDFILQKIREKPSDRIWIKDVSNGRYEIFGNIPGNVTKIASGLTRLGFGKGDVLCMFCSNFVEYWLIALATWTCGGCVMPLNCEMEPKNLENQLTLGKAKILVCDELNIADAIAAMEQVESLVDIVVIGQPEEGVEHCKAIGDLLEDDGKAAPKKIDADWDKQTIFLPFTSTSSGSKGIEHTHKSLVSSFYSPEGAANHWFDQYTGDGVVCGNWFFHMTGLYAFVLAAIHGITLYTQSEYSDLGLLEAMVENKVSTVTLYSWQIRMLSHSQEVGRFDLSTLKVILTAGGILSATIRMEAMERFPSLRYIREAYGLNECGIITLTYPREKKNSVPGGLKAIDLPDDHVMPVGWTNMYSQIKIINRQTETNVEGPDENGEICIKSPQCFKGYLNTDHKKTFDSDGFFHTGDLGYYDNQGILYFIESLENLIHFWMYEVAPSILESRLLGSTNIVDAAVVGIPDKENGEVPRAFVVLRPGFEETEENITNIMESRLQDHERIRGGLFFIQNIPRDENWKVRRDILAAYDPNKTIHNNSNNETGESDKVVQELNRQPNGTFVASALSECTESSSPRMKRSNKIDSNNSSVDNPEMKRRGSMDCILEEGVTTIKAGVATSFAETRGGGRRGSRIPSSSGGNSRRGSTDMGEPTTVNSTISSDSFTYWFQVCVEPANIEKVLKTHVAVDDCSIQGFHVPGIGNLPRAYVVLKHGYMISADELIQHVNSRVPVIERILGGLVFVDKFARDSNGKLFHSLEKWDSKAQGIDDQIFHQPRVDVS